MTAMQMLMTSRTKSVETVIKLFITQNISQNINITTMQYSISLK